MATWRGVFGLLCLLPAAVWGDDCQAYIDQDGQAQPAESCPYYCCGSCVLRYCCSNPFLKFDEEQQYQCNPIDGRITDSSSVNYMQYFSDPDDYFSSGPSFGILVVIGVAVCAVIIITIVLCLTYTCRCLYKACRRPQSVVSTTTTATTVVHGPYPQQQGVPPNYPVAPYQGYQPVAVEARPGVPVAPYPAQHPARHPAQYPPPYAVPSARPPAYHETVAAGAGAPYPVSQPPYNPAYMDPQKPTY